MDDKKNRKSKLRIVDRQAELTEKRLAGYRENATKIESMLDSIVGQICKSEPVDPNGLKEALRRITKRMFYGKSNKVVDFLSNISTYHPEILFETIMDFDRWIMGKNSREVVKPQSWNTFLQNKTFEFKNRKATMSPNVNLDTSGISDDL